ncbi:MAG: hypothetical protein Q9208_004737 [Pyrenodesmia sp. 3 TL-2023]
MSRILSTITTLALSAISLYAARKSYIAITNLRRYEERSEKAAKHSETAAHELYKTRATQGSSAAAIVLSLVSSFALCYRALSGSTASSMAEYVVPALNVAAIAAAFVHNQNYWKAKAKVPFVGGINEGIEKSKEIRQSFVILGSAWVVFGMLHLIGV